LSRVAGDKDLNHVSTPGQSSPRQAASNGLREGGEIGRHANLLMDAARCDPKAAYDLIEDEDGPRLRREFAQLLQVTQGRRNRAGPRTLWLQDDCRHVAALQFCSKVPDVV
jgi:hypothetical protein